ncbi:hypothetical protein BLA27_09560 [Brucella cytisi]|uniref:Uncharacterized protein n=2 Tax=Brucella cytisi TaxID=407152 RepID=A0A1J6I077_9HYPH|nr:hypothetical protein BLA27_09560 [Brucella cytisi]
MTVREFLKRSSLGAGGKMIHNIDWEEHIPILDVFNELAAVENSIYSDSTGQLVVPEEWARELMLEAEKKALASLLAIASALLTD